MDWLTLTVEIIGIVIFVVFFIVPIREFREIFHRLKTDHRRLAEPPDQAFPPITKEPPHQ